MAARNRSKSSKSVTQPKTNAEKLVFSAFVRKTLHSSVVLLNLVTLIWFGIRCFQASQVPEIASLEFVRHGINNIPFYFSFWVSALQYAYFALYSVIDSLEAMSEKRRNLHQVIDRMHTIASYLLFTIVFPLSLMIGILFWSIYHWDRALIYPSVLDEYVSQWPNHVMHTLPIPLSVVYMLVSNKKEPPKLLTLSGLMMFMIVYSCIFFAVKITQGKYVYLCLEKIPPSGVPVALSFAFVSPILFHSLGYKINDLFKKISLPKSKRKTRERITTLRKLLHTVVAVLLPLAGVRLIYGIFGIYRGLPEFAQSDFFVYGHKNAPFFISLWGFSVQIVYFWTYSYIDMLELFSERRKLLSLAIDWLHSTASFLLFAVVFPSTMTVGILFWALYLRDRTYLHPPIMDDWLPVWGNHVLYTLPMFLCLAYMATSNREEPSKRGTLAFLLAFLSTYSYVFLQVKISTGKWVHLCLEHLSHSETLATLAFAVVAPIFFHQMGYKMNEFITRKVGSYSV